MVQRILLIISVILSPFLLFVTSSRALDGDNDIQVNDESKDVAGQVETTIVVNPTDPMNVIGGAIEIMKDGTFRCAYYTSLDGGKTWPFSGLLPISNELFNSADPDLAVDAQGNIYYVYLNGLIDEEGNITETNLAVAKSTDKGMTFGPPVEVVNSRDEPYNVDKELLTVDTTDSLYSGYLYLVWWANILDEGAQIRLSRSIDGGKNWSIPQTISDSAPGPMVIFGSNPAVGPDGEVYVAWFVPGWLIPNEKIGERIYIDKSTDGGVTFGEDILAANVQSNFYSAPSNGLPPYDVSSTMIFPSIDIDRTEGPYRGNIYIAWDDARNRDSDIYFTRSTDGAAHWDTAIRVNDDTIGNGKDQFFAALTVDPIGRIHVIFFDRREDPENKLINLYYTYSGDGGETFSKNVKVNDHPFDNNDSALHPISGNPGFIGDYIQVAASSTTVFPLWPVAGKENGNGDTDLFTALTVGIDTDEDGFGDEVDNCPGDYNPGQEDTDKDSVGDACDNCKDVQNHNQEDKDGDVVGDACERVDRCGAISFLLPGSPYGFFGGIMVFMALIVGIRWRMRY